MRFVRLLVRGEVMGRIKVDEIQASLPDMVEYRGLEGGGEGCLWRDVEAAVNVRGGGSSG